MANCGLLLTSGDQTLQTTGDLLTLTADCSAPVIPTRFATYRENTTAIWQEANHATYREATHATHREN